MPDEQCFDPIDVWDVSTFDDDLLGTLNEAASLLRDYLETAQANYLEREVSDHTRPYPTNRFGSAYGEFVDSLAPMMNARTIRTWHYSRLTDAETADLTAHGVRSSDLADIRSRLDALVSSGTISSRDADRLFIGSPFQSDQRESRSNKFWMVSHPHQIDDGGVELLLESWGGEGVYFWQRDPDLCALLKSIGRPRIVELSIPMAATDHDYSAGRAVIASFARKLGCHADSCVFDLYAVRPLGPASILAIHSEGDSSYGRMGSGYPVTYSNALAGFRHAF
jgi:hypothetical protein